MRDLTAIGVAVIAALVTTYSSAMAGGQTSSDPPLALPAILAQTAPASSPVEAVARAVRVVISGKVQGVGYRNWAVMQAKELKIRGWVENAPDGSVHALFGGSETAVSAMLTACRKGPRGARVRDVAVTPADAADLPAGFSRRN